MKSKTLKGLSLALALTLAVGCMPGIDVSAKAKKAEVKTTKTVTKSKKTTTKTQKAEVKAAKADTASNKGAYGPGSVTIADGKYYIMSAADNSYGLDLAANKTDSGTNVQLYKQSSDDVWAFEIKRMSDGYYRIGVPGTSQVLDAAGGGATNGTNIQIYTDNGTDAQRWVIEDAGGGYYYIKSKISGLLFDISGNNISNNTNIILYENNGGYANQKWMFVPDGYGPGQKTIEDGEYRIMTGIDTTYGMDLEANSHESGTNIQLYKVSTNDVPLLEVAYQNNGYYTIGVKGTDVVFDVADGKKADATNVRLWTKNGSDAQLWVIEEAGDDFYFIRSKLDGRALDVYGAQATNKANIVTHTLHKGANQKWKFFEEPTTKLEDFTTFSIAGGFRFRWATEGDMNNRKYKIDKTYPKGKAKSVASVNPFFGLGVSSDPDGLEVRYRENEEGSEWEQVDAPLSEDGTYAEIKGLTGGTEYVYTVRPFYYYKILGISIGIKNYKQAVSKEMKRTTLESNENDIKIGDNTHKTLSNLANKNNWYAGMHQQSFTEDENCLYDMVCKNKDFQIWIGYSVVKNKLVYSWEIYDYDKKLYKKVFHEKLLDLKKDFAIYAQGSKKTRLSTEYIKYAKNKEYTVKVLNSSKKADWSIAVDENPRIKYGGVEILKTTKNSVTFKFKSLKGEYGVAPYIQAKIGDKVYKCFIESKITLKM